MTLDSQLNGVYCFVMGKIFYGWIVCGVCTLLIFISMGTASNGLSVFLPYIIKACELTNTQASSLVTLRCAFAFLSMLVISLYYKRVGYRLGTCISALCCCAAYSIYSFANTYPQFCVGASMAGISYGLGSMIPVSILMNRWFVRHRALAIGICASGSGLAVIILPPILTGIILRFSLRAAFLVTAGFTLVAAVLVYLLIREKPADMGLEALGEGDRIEPHKSKFRRSEPRRNASERSASDRTAADRAAADRSAADQSASGLSASERLAARRKSSKGNPDTQSDSVWILIGMVCVIMGGLSNPGFVHLSVLYTSEGYAPMTVAFLISLCGIVLTLGKVLCGGVADLMGGLKASLLFIGLLLAGLVMCCFAFTGSVPLAAIAVFLFGVGSPVCTVGIPVWAGDLSEPKDYPKTVRNLQLIYAAGAMLFASTPGVIADHLGSYIPVYAIFAISLAGTAVCLIAAYRLRK